MISALLIAGAYLLGAIPFGLLLALGVAGVDVRELGSGNTGATNVARTAGKGLGILTLLLDCAKGAGPVLLAQYIFLQPILVVVGVGLATVVGHMFPIYLRFKGGKGVATGLGLFAALTPLSTGVAVAVFALLFGVFRLVSVGSLGAVLGLVAATVLLDGRPEVITLAALVAVLIVVRHRENIVRILRRTETGI